MTEAGAPRRAGLRVALVGKGGAGKSAIAGTLARALAQRGHRVLALDVDTLPGLAWSLGLSPAVVGDAGLPEDLAERHPERGWGLRDVLYVETLVAEHALLGPDGEGFIHLGKLPGRVKPGSTTAFRVVLEEFRAEGWTLVGDLAAGTRQPFFGWSDFAEVVLVVVEPSTKAILTGRRLARLAEGRAAPDLPPGESAGPILGLVANKLRTAADLAYIQAGLAAAHLRLLGLIPYDEALAAAERAGAAPIDAALSSAAVTAIRDLAVALEHLTQQLRRGVQT
jgi:CO dehydrogenase maturation factor